jgi:hypothetical protein
MKTVLGFFIQMIFMSVASAGFFIATSLVSPIKAMVSHPESHIPRMSIRFTDFSPAYAALEDDYYVGDYENEQIPKDVVAKELKPGTVDMVLEKPQRIEIPSMKMNPHPTLSQYNGGEEGGWKKPTPQKMAEAPTAHSQTQYLPDGRIPHYWLQGKMELTQGLAITDPRDEIRVGWFLEGRKMNEGRININQGTYEIKAERLEGEVIAELVDSKGYVLGEAIVDLDLLAKQRMIQQIIVPDVDLKLTPYSLGPKGQVVSVYNTPQNPSPIAAAELTYGEHDEHTQTRADGKFNEESISSHSTAVLAANRGQYRESLVLADFEKAQTIRMFPEKFMRDFFDIIELDNKFRDLGVIWGTIRKEDVPVGGLHVRIAGHPEVPTVYFTYYIPDEKRKDTSTDGQYAFVGMIDGDYEVEVLNAQDQKIDSKVITVRAGAVSSVEFEIGERKILYVRPFDPFTLEPQGVEVMAMGSDRILNTKTEDTLKLPVTKGTDPVLLYSKPESGKIESNTFASRTRKFQEVPILNTIWWNRIQSQYKIQASSGVIVGFIDSDAPFEVFNEDTTPSTKILYFNQAGQIIKGAGQKPSGFILYGTGKGLKTLIIESGTGLLTTEASFVDGEAISLLYKNI